jgi:hypothetical protein
MGEGNENLVYTSPWNFKRSLTCRKILRYGTSFFISHAKEGVLLICIALKNPSPWQGSNPKPMGPVASTLTTTPPRRLPGHTLYTGSTTTLVVTELLRRQTVEQISGTLSNLHGAFGHSHVEPVKHYMGDLLRAIVLESSPNTHCLLPSAPHGRWLGLKLKPSLRQLMSLLNFHLCRHGNCNRTNCNIKPSTRMAQICTFYGQFAMVPSPQPLHKRFPNSYSLRPL